MSNEPVPAAHPGKRNGFVYALALVLIFVVAESIYVNTHIHNGFQSAMMLTWLPYWSFYTIRDSADQLRVVAPPDIMQLLVLIIIGGIPWFRSIFKDVQTHNIGTPLGFLLWYGGTAILALGLITPHGVITLNRKDNTARIARMHFMWIPTWKTVPLNDVDRATSESSAHSNHFVLMMKDGDTYGLMYWTQMSGQGMTARTVNTFLDDARSQNPQGDALSRGIPDEQ